jgi:hypothetical protein
MMLEFRLALAEAGKAVTYLSGRLLADLQGYRLKIGPHLCGTLSDRAVLPKYPPW